MRVFPSLCLTFPVVLNRRSRLALISAHRNCYGNASGKWLINLLQTHDNIPEGCWRIPAVLSSFKRTHAVAWATRTVVEYR